MKGRRSAMMAFELNAEGARLSISRAQARSDARRKMGLPEQLPQPGGSRGP